MSDPCPRFHPLKTPAVLNQHAAGSRGCRSGSVRGCLFHASARTLRRSAHNGGPARNPAQPEPWPDITHVLRTRAARSWGGPHLWWGGPHCWAVPMRRAFTFYSVPDSAVFTIDRVFDLLCRDGHNEKICIIRTHGSEPFSRKALSCKASGTLSPIRCWPAIWAI